MNGKNEYTKDGFIVDMFLARDEKAIEYTSEKYGKSLRSIAYNVLHSERDAEECENDTYMKAWNSIPPNEPREYLFAFLAKIARRLSLDRYRDQNRIKRHADMVELSEELEDCALFSSEVETHIDAIELGRIISAFLKAQSDQRRTVFIRRYWYMDPISEISKKSGMSESKIKSLLFRIRGDLKERLKKEGYDI